MSHRPWRSHTFWDRSGRAWNHTWINKLVNRIEMNFDLIFSNILQNIMLTSEEIDYVKSILKYKVISKKSFLLRKGEVCHNDYFVTKGCLKVCYLDPKGNESIIKFAIENFWVVDLDSFLNYKPSYYYIQAIENTEVLYINKPQYDILHSKIPAFYKFSNKRWQDGFVALQHRIIQSNSLRAEERFVLFKEKYPGLDQRISQKHIAAYLGVTPEFLSVLRKKWATTFS